MRARARSTWRTPSPSRGPPPSPRSSWRPIPGTAGIMMPPPGYLAGVREICDQYGIVFVLDEVMAGFGRTGEWFAADLFDVVPDLMTFAKGVNSGYVPLGGVAISGADRRDLRAAPLPRRPHLLRAPAGLRRRRRHDQRDGGGGHRRARRPPRRDVLGPGAARAGRAAPDRRRGARHRRVLGAGPGHGTGRPASRWCRTTRRARRTRPMAAFGAAAKKQRPVAVRQHEPHPRRAAVQRHARPRLKEGLAALDAALSVADEHTE